MASRQRHLRARHTRSCKVPEAVKWVKRWERELWEGRVEAVIAALHREREREGAQGEAAREQIHYFETNKERMRY